jgi:hypothetical protein
VLANLVGTKASNTELLPGDVLLVSSRSWVMLLIAFWLRSQWNHVAVVHHTDDAGVQWAIEAAPGGVAWRNVATLGRFIHNADQPKTDEQRQVVADGCESMLRMGYDWNAIALEAFQKLDRHGVSWTMEWDGPVPPVHIICSSLSAYWYWVAKLAGPHSWLARPAPEWSTFIKTRAWEVGVPGRTQDRP